MIVRILSVFILFLSLIFSCDNGTNQKSFGTEEAIKIRSQTDTIGFASKQYQMDSIYSRMDPNDTVQTRDVYKAVICPHDDYAYAGGLYAKTLSGIKAHIVIMIGVAHKAKNFGLNNKLIFGTFDFWKSAHGNIKISPLRNELIKRFPKEMFTVHDSMIIVEHSLEAITPFIKRNNKNVEIIPILVPYMDFKTMLNISDKFTEILYRIIQENNFIFGKDIAIVISNDAVHYGDSDWGKENMAPFGTDSIGNAKAYEKELEIIENCLIGEINLEKIKLFSEYTVQKQDYKEYKWIWCGRYSVPFGLLLSENLNKTFFQAPLTGILLDYRTSYLNKHIKVDDLGMGTTAPANNRHWVGYAGIAYK